MAHPYMLELARIIWTEFCGLSPVWTEFRGLSPIRTEFRWLSPMWAEFRVGWIPWVESRVGWIPLGWIPLGWIPWVESRVDWIPMEPTSIKLLNKNMMIDKLRLLVIILREELKGSEFICLYSMTVRPTNQVNYTLDANFTGNLQKTSKKPLIL